MTYQGNPVMDAAFNTVDDVAALNRRISDIPGVVDTSLFVGIAAKAIVAQPDGTVTVIDRP